MHDGHTQRVEAHQAQHGPVEGLRLDNVPDEKAQSALPPLESRSFQLGALQARPGERRPWKGEQGTAAGISFRS